MAKKLKPKLTQEEKTARVEKLLESKELLPNGFEIFEQTINKAATTKVAVKPRGSK